MNGNGEVKHYHPDLVSLLEDLLEILQEMDEVVEITGRKVMSNQEARSTGELDDFTLESEADQLERELAVASTASIQLRAILATAGAYLS